MNGKKTHKQSCQFYCWASGWWAYLNTLGCVFTRYWPIEPHRICILAPKRIWLRNDLQCRASVWDGERNSLKDVAKKLIYINFCRISTESFCFFLWYDSGMSSYHACVLSNDRIAIIVFICKINTQLQFRPSILKLAGTLCNNDRAVIMILITLLNGMHPLCIQGSFWRLISWFPPFAPVAWECTLIWLRIE